MGLWDKIKDGLTTDKGEIADDLRNAADKAKAKADEAAADAGQSVPSAPSAPSTPAAPAGKADAPAPPAASPKKDHPVRAKKKHKEYTVVSGDTLSEIGARFGVDWHDIARINDIPNPDLIYPGQVFKIPNN
jgi:nucleoid-associated protein YgaU